MPNMQQPDRRPVESRLADVEGRLDSLEQLGKEGLPAIRLTAIEIRLEHLEGNVRDLKDELNRRLGETDKRIEGVAGRLTTILTVYTGIVTLAVVLSQLFIP